MQESPCLEAWQSGLMQQFAKLSSRFTLVPQVQILQLPFVMLRSVAQLVQSVDFIRRRLPVRSWPLLLCPVGEIEYHPLFLKVSSLGLNPGRGTFCSCMPPAF